MGISRKRVGGPALAHGVVAWRRLRAGSTLRRVRRDVNRRGATNTRRRARVRAAARAAALLLALLLALTRAASLVAAQAAADSVATREVAPGVTLRRVARPTGPWVLHVLEVDLRRRELDVRAVRACDRLSGRERPSAVARRLRAEGTDVVAVLNADFFDLEGGTGENENNLVVDGELVKGVEVTESPFDTFDNVHTQFAVTAAGTPLLERFRLAGIVRTPRGRWPLGAVNAAPAPGTLALLTRWADSTTRAVVSRAERGPMASVPLARLAARGDTVRYRVLAPSRRAGAPSAGWDAFLVGAGAVRRVFARLRAGDRVTVVARLTPDRGALRTLVGGWPRIVRAGVNVAGAADSAEGTFPRFSARRHPRSAVGFSRDSSTLYLVAVDGRRQSSVGMTLAELADAMIALGTFDALNLDGGGSTALVVGDSVVNAPSDSTGERPVGDVLVVTRRPVASADAPAPRHVPARERPASCVVAGNRDPDRQ
jgi:hypothetical protein